MTCLGGLYGKVYPLYSRMRREAPVHRVRVLDLYFLTRYRDVEAVLKDPRFSVDRAAFAPPSMNPLLTLPEEFRTA